jgi:divalent metal cation (Fe/Co/Zn/Cd) transporter
LTPLPRNVSIAGTLDRGIDMARASGIMAFIVAVVFVAAGVGFMIQRIGSVIGWHNVTSGWPVIVLLVGLILLVSFLIYKSVRSKLDS